MSCLPFQDQAAIALAPAFRERFDFTQEEDYKKFADMTWKAAKALVEHRPAPIEAKPADAPAKKEAAK